VQRANDQALSSQAASSLISRLKLLVGLRLLLASALLGSAGILDLTERLPFRTPPLYAILALTFALSLAYALALRAQWHPVWNGRVQIALDLMLVTLLVHFTGGLDSVFPFMYIFVVLAAANLLERPAGLTVSIVSSLSYGGLVLAEWTRMIAPAEFVGGLAPHRTAGYALYQVLIHGVAFLAVGILSNHLAYRLRQTGQELEQRGLDLSNLQTLHQAIVANISSGLMSLDLSGRIVSFNQAAERITGFDSSTMRDRSWEETAFSVCPILAEFFAHPDVPLNNPLTEINLQRQDRRFIPLGISCSPLRGADGSTVGVVAIFQDLTERKRGEEQLRRADRLAALGQLAANIAHEVRNPLAAISGAVEVLREDQSMDGSNRELLGIVLGETHRLKLITGQFLDFAKPQPLLFRPCAVRPLLEETLHLLKRSGQRHPDTKWQVMEREPNTHVLADADQLRQVVWNLCLNAIQAMPNGGHLTVAIEPGSPGRPMTRSSNVYSPDEGKQGSGPHAANHPPGISTTSDWVEIAFQDTGRGIPPEELQRIFDPFFTTRPSGTGLGLAIARKISESMGGRIEVESQIGAGTTFRLRLQRAKAAMAVSGKA
jgi:two-component system sensor histidine kinase PilS (NtrC family)